MKNKVKCFFLIIFSTLFFLTGCRKSDEKYYELIYGSWEYVKSWDEIGGKSGPSEMMVLEKNGYLSYYLDITDKWKLSKDSILFFIEDGLLYIEHEKNSSAFYKSKIRKLNKCTLKLENEDNKVKKWKKK